MSILFVRQPNEQRLYTSQELVDHIFATLELRRIKRGYGGFLLFSDPKDQFDRLREKTIIPVSYSDKIYTLELTTDLGDIQRVMESLDKPIFMREINGLDQVVKDISAKTTKPNAGMIDQNLPKYSHRDNRTQVAYPFQLFTI